MGYFCAVDVRSTIRANTSYAQNFHLASVSNKVFSTEDRKNLLLRTLDDFFRTEVQK